MMPRVMSNSQQQKNRNTWSHSLVMDRSTLCPCGSTRVGVEKCSPGSRDTRCVSWDIYDYVSTFSRTPTLESCASPEPDEPATSAVLLYLGGDALSVNAELTLRLRASYAGLPLHPRVQALRASPLDALRGELQPSAASSSSLDSRGRRADSALLASKSLEEAYRAYDAFTRGERPRVDRIVCQRGEPSGKNDPADRSLRDRKLPNLRPPPPPPTKDIS